MMPKRFLKITLGNPYIPFYTNCPGLAAAIGNHAASQSYVHLLKFVGVWEKLQRYCTVQRSGPQSPLVRRVMKYYQGVLITSGICT